MAKKMGYERKMARRNRNQPSNPGAVPHNPIPSSPLAADEGSYPDGEEAEIPTAPALPDEPPVKGAMEDPQIPQQDARQAIAQSIQENPKYRIPTGKPTETFDGMRARALPVVRAAMQELAHDPTKYIPIVLDAQATNIINGWIDAGMPDDFSVNAESMSGSAPSGAVERLFPVKEAPGWRKEAIRLDGSTPLPPPPGILLIVHGGADKAGSTKRGGQQETLAQLARQVKSGDFSRARAEAHKASTVHGISDEDIDAIINSSLPSPEESASLPHDRLLAVASAAHGSAKFPQYAALLKERFGNLDSLPPEARQQLSAHLGALGV